MKVSSVSPERCEMIEVYPLRRANSIASSVSETVPIWLTLIRIEFAMPCSMPLLQPLRVGHEQIVAHKLHTPAQLLGQVLPAVPIILCQAILDRHDRVLPRPVRPEVSHLLLAQFRSCRTS